MTAHDEDLSRLIGTRHPVIQAPMAQVSTIPLAVAVSEAGGLGSLAAGLLSADQIRAAIGTIRASTRRPFNVNLFILRPEPPDRSKLAKAQDLIAEIERSAGADGFAFDPPPPPPPYQEQLAVIAEERVPVFSFTFGVPDPAELDLVRESGAVILGTATSVEEARHLEAAGVDAIVAQGSEAGGHRGTFLHRAEEALTETARLVSEVSETVGVPVVASGGIMNGREIAHAMSLGAAGVQLGTSFLCCPETALPPFWTQAIRSGRETVLTRTLTGKLARTLRNRFVEIMAPHEAELPEFPHVAVLTGRLRAWASANGDVEYLPLLAGSGSAQARSLPAGELLAALIAEARDAAPAP